MNLYKFNDTMTEAEDFLNSSLIVNSVLNTFLSYTAIMLNIITIHALRKTSSLPKPLKALFLSLSVSDLSVGFLVQPLNVASLVMRLKENSENNPTLKNINDVFNYTSVLLCYASFFGVTAVTADRFFAIHLHLRYQELVTHRRLVAVVTSIWVLSAILSPLWLWNRKIYSIVTAITLTVCLMSATFFNCKIYLAVRHHTHQIKILQVHQAVTQNNEVIRTNTVRHIKSAVGTFYVSLVFLACYLPHIIINVVHAITGEFTLMNTLWIYTMTLVYLNSSLNPLIYCWKMRHIRHAIMNILRNMFQAKQLTKTAWHN